MKHGLKVIGSFLVVLVSICTVLTGCANNREGQVNVLQSMQDGEEVVATNPPITQKIFYETEDEQVAKKKKKKSKKQILAKRKVSSETEREKLPDGDMLSFMKKRCKKYGCSGSSSPNFYKVLQDTSEAYGISIAQAQAAWEN